MTVTVAMYDKGLDHIGDRLAALGLDIDVIAFGKDGKFHIDGKAVSPDAVAVDYLWLSPHLNMDSAAGAAFNLVLECKSVDVLQTFNAGLDNPIYKKISDKGVRICNSSAQAVAIAEYTIAHILSLFHPIDTQREQQARKEWKLAPFREIWRTNWLIFGYGPIGQELTKRLKAFEANVSVVRRSVTASPPADRSGTEADIGNFLPDADVIVLACPLNDETRGFVGADFFAAVKPGAILVNIARGALIDDAAMIAALDNGRLEHAVLDVFHTEPLPTDDPLWSHPKVRLTPHTSFAGSGGRTRWDELFLDNIQRYVRGEPLLLEVDPKVIV